MTTSPIAAADAVADLGLCPPRWTRRVDPIARRLFPLAVVVGVAARFAVSRRGSNYDFDAWTTIRDVINAGGNIYSDPSTEVFVAYGPIWFVVLDLLDTLAGFLGGETLSFRYLIILTLTMGDVAVALLIGRLWGWTGAVLVLLNPVSIVITGYHNQIDVLSIGVMLAAAIVMARNGASPGIRDSWLGSAIFGIGLATKHVGVFFHGWLFLRPGTWRQRTVRATVGPVIFALSFLPWMDSGAAISRVRDRIVGHSGGRPGLLRDVFDVPRTGVTFIAVYVVWVVVLVALGWALRHVDVCVSAIVFLLANLAFAPGFANQHLVLGVAAASVLLAPELVLAMMLGSLLVLQNSDGAHFQFFMPRWFELEGHMYAWIQAVLWVWFARLGWRAWRGRRAGGGSPAGVGSRAQGVSGAGA